MSYSQNKLGKRVEGIFRYACMIGASLVGLVFTFILVVCCVRGVHDHPPVAALFILPFLGVLAALAFYISYGLWRNSFANYPQKIVIELQAHDFHSTMFYKIAARYFRRRLRVIRNCSLFFFFMAALSVPLFFITQADWWIRIITFVSSLFCAAICRTPYTFGKHGIRMIDAASRLDQHHQVDCLRFMATNIPTFRRDPVGIYILTLSINDKPAP